MARRAFPDDFLWGTATSAPQIEGSTAADGRGASIWDRFADVPGAIVDGSNLSKACDTYRRWRDDVALVRDLGVGAYRFSIAWPRIVPNGDGKVASRGLDWYDAFVDALLEAGIRPFPTLYHWDLPQALQDRGGWLDRGVVDAFVAYADAVARRLGDRVTQWTTINEPWCVAFLGHETGRHAPGIQDPAASLRAAHHVLLAHGRAATAIRDAVPGVEVGIVTNNGPVDPLTDSAADRDAARWYDGQFNRWYLDPLFRGRYPDDAVADRIAAGHLDGPELPFVEMGDMGDIAAPLDFLGVNYYSRVVMRATPDGRRESVLTAPPGQLTDMGWEIDPMGLRRILLRIHRDYSPRALYVTENGAAYDDPVDADGRVRDERRIRYLDDHLRSAAEAMADGAPLAGYFVWSLMDNFEWSYGYTKRFGLVSVDFATGERVPKDSFRWYRDVVAAGGPGDAPTPFNPRRAPCDRSQNTESR